MKIGKLCGRSLPQLVPVLLVAACDSSEPELRDREVLALLYESTGGSEWRYNHGWLSDDEMGTWFGVRTDDAGQVVGIELDNNNLVGTIPPELGNLSSLRTLGLARNSLTGPIPPELGNLSSLGYLNLYNNFRLLAVSNG